MLAPLVRIHDVNSPVAACKPILDEREQHAVFFVIAVEERTDMACCVELRPSKSDWRHRRFHLALLPYGSYGACGKTILCLTRSRQ